MSTQSEPRESRAARAPAVHKPGDKCRVLVVEDDDPLREAVRFVLEDTGHEVFEAPDGQIALDMLRLAEHPLIVLLDYMMPRMSGLQLLSVASEDARLMDGNRFILMTAVSGLLPSALAAVVQAHAIPVVEKPFEMDLMLEVVAQACQDLRARDARTERGGPER